VVVLWTAPRHAGHFTYALERIDERGRAQQELFADEVLVSRRRNDPWVGEHKGLTLHAGVRFGALDRTGRERLVRYCTRPPVAMERLSILRDGSVAYRLEYASKRRSHRVMQPMERMARLAAIVAPPGLPLTRYHGVLAPNSSWRRQIVAQAPACSDGYEPGPRPHQDAKREQEAPERACAPQPPRAPLDPPLDPQAFSNANRPDAEQPNAESAQATPPKPRSRTSTSYVPWAELMRRTLGIHPLVCPVCSATMVLLAVITQKETIRRILTHVKLPRTAVTNDATSMLYFDVTGKPVPPWTVGVDPVPEQRGPPPDYDVVDPPTPDE
jgi:hypothetical protein